MCLIAATSVGKSNIPMEYLENAFEHNSDGWGIMFPKGDKTLETRNSLSGFKEFERYWSEVVPDNTPVAVHFRFTTRGGKTVDNTHPFKVFDWKTHKYDLAMMHNGTIRIDESDFPNEQVPKNWSDSKLFVHKIVKPLFKHSPGIIRKDVSRKVLSEFIGGGNKLVFMDGNGNITFVNEQEGEWRNSVWYSNTYSLERPYYKRTSFASYKSLYSGYDGDSFGGSYGRFGESEYDRWLSGERDKAGAVEDVKEREPVSYKGSKIYRDVEPEEQLEFEAVLTEQAIEQILVNNEGDLDDDILDSMEEYVRDNTREVAKYLVYKVGME